MTNKREPHLGYNETARKYCDIILILLISIISAVKKVNVKSPALCEIANQINRKFALPVQGRVSA